MHTFTAALLQLVSIGEIRKSAAQLYSRERNSNLARTSLLDNRMPIQRRTPTEAEIIERNRLREEKAKIHTWQVDALDKLYLRDHMSDFILAVHEHFPSAAGDSTDVLEIAKAVGKPVKRTCELLMKLSETGIGGPSTKRMILDEEKPFTRFKWNGNFDDLVQALVAKWNSEQLKKAL